jgi:hypothetical protein
MDRRVDDQPPCDECKCTVGHAYWCQYSEMNKSLPNESERVYEEEDFQNMFPPDDETEEELPEADRKYLQSLQ